MFNKKEILDLKDTLNNKLDEIRNEFAIKFDEHSNSITQLHESTKELKTEHNTASESFKINLEEIGHLKTEFETALNRVNSISHTIEDRASENIKEVAEKEIESIQDSTRQFREVESDLKQLLHKIGTLQLEISKFISISQQIKLVDFTLKQHQDELSRTERERMNLVNENERLKSMIGKMKRNH